MVTLRQALVAAATVAFSASAAAVDITVSASGGNDTGYGQTRYGFLHEDINNSGDGGIYAELIRNRAFQYSPEYPVSLDGYHAINGAKLSLRNLSTPLSDALPVSMRVNANGRSGAVGFENDGYWGMDVKKQKYTGSFWVKGEYHGHFTASLQSNLTNAVFGSTKVKSKCVAGEWVEHKYELTPHKDAPNSNNTLAITFDPAVSPAVSLLRLGDRANHERRALPTATSTSTSSASSRRRTRAGRTVCVSISPRLCTMRVFRSSASQAATCSRA